MNRQPKAVLLVCGLALSVISATANAQVAPPPTEPAQDQPTYTPPPKPEPKPVVKPAEPKPQEGFSARKREGAEDLPTHVPYPKLAQKGEDGRIIRLRQLPDIAALRSNPNVGPKTLEQIMPLIYLRRYKMEGSVIDNLDLYWELSSGLIQNMNMGDITEMGRVADMMRPLVPENTLSQDTLNRNLMTRVQGGMNKYIVNEYKKAITDEIQVLDGDNGLEEVMRFVLEDSLHEATLAYQGMLVELMEQVDVVCEKAGVSETEALVALKKKPSVDPQEQLAQIEAFDQVFRTLSYEDAINIFTVMRGEREFENISPTIAKIEVLHDRKKEAGENADWDVIVTDKTNNEVKFDGRKKDDEAEAEGSEN
jgi:hypothetical protein